MRKDFDKAKHLSEEAKISYVRLFYEDKPIPPEVRNVLIGNKYTP